jgi:hypothetical protein
MTNHRNRKGQFSHLDREYRTASERRDFRQAESQLIATFAPVVIVSSAADLRSAEIEQLREKAAATKSAYNRKIYEQRLRELGASQ